MLFNVLFERSCEGGHPSGVALKGASENQLLGHDETMLPEAVDGKLEGTRCRLVGRYAGWHRKFAMR